VFFRKENVAEERVGDIAGHYNTRGYIRIKIDGVAYQAHRLAWFYHYKEQPTDTIDHINGHKADNSISNLRVVSQAENCKNRGLNDNNKSGQAGVGRKGCGWYARIETDEGRIHLGTFENIEDAIVARKLAEVEYGFHINHGNKRGQ